MADLPPASLVGNLGYPGPSIPPASDGGSLMGESDMLPPLPLGSESADSDSSGEIPLPLGFADTLGVSEIFRAAQTLADSDRISAVEERKKIQVLMDFILSMGFSLEQVNEFKNRGALPLPPVACMPTGSQLEVRPSLGGLDSVSPSQTGILPVVNTDAPPKDTHPPLASVVGAGTSSWSSVVAGTALPRDQRVTLNYFPPVENLGKITIAPPVSVLRKGLQQWSNSLTGRFLHSKLPFSVVEPFAQKHWGGLGLTKVLRHDQGHYVFKFATPADRDNVLALGPWYISNKLILLKPWREGVNSTQELCNKVPVWVKFQGVPYSYWTPEGLSFIASGVGKPLFLDKATENLLPMNYARICVEIDINSQLPKVLSVNIINEEDNVPEVVDVKVEYQNIPPICLHCQTFGHSRLKCPAANFQWVPKSDPLKESSAPGSSNPPVANSEAVPSTSFPAQYASALPEALTSTSNLAVHPSVPEPVHISSSNSFAALTDLELTSPASCASFCNQQLLSKLKVVDEKERKDKAASGVVPSGSSGKDTLRLQSHVAITDEFLGSLAPLDMGCSGKMTNAPAGVAEFSSAKKRNKGKGKKHPKHPTPPP